jgi:hypothetical protein
MGWLIFIDILLIIILALMLSVTVNVHLNDETRIKIRYAGITIFSVSPEDEKHKKQKKSKEKQKKSPDDKSDNISADNEKTVQDTENTADKANGSSDISKESKKTHKVEKKADNNGNNGLLSKLGLSGDISETIEFVKQLILSASKPIKRLISHIRVSNFYLFITASGEDAAQAAMNYGKINWLVHTALAVLYNTVKLNVKKIDITADFTSGKTKYELSCKVKLRLGTAIGCVLWLLFRTAKLYLKINSKNVNKTATAESNTKPKAEKA